MLFTENSGILKTQKLFIVVFHSTAPITPLIPNENVNSSLLSSCVLIQDVERSC